MTHGFTNYTGHIGWWSLTFWSNDTTTLAFFSKKSSWAKFPVEQEVTLITHLQTESHSGSVSSQTWYFLFLFPFWPGHLAMELLSDYLVLIAVKSMPYRWAIFELWTHYHSQYDEQCCVYMLGGILFKSYVQLLSTTCILCLLFPNPVFFLPSTSSGWGRSLGQAIRN